MKTGLRIGVFLKTLISVFFVVFLLSTTTALAQLTFGPDVPAVSIPEPSVPLTFGPDVGPAPIAPTDPSLYPIGTPVTPGGGSTSETVTSDGVTYSTSAPAPEPDPPIIIGDGFLNSLYGFVLVFGGKLVYWSGELLNWAVDSLVVGFGTIYLDWGIGFAVEAGWKIIRDVLNLSFIFAIVYIGIRLIFDADDSSAKRSLGYLIAAALLINFSLFISKFVIDFSNSLAAIIYTTGLEGARADIGSAFINVLGLSTIIKVNVSTIDIGGDTAVGLSIIFGTFIFMLMATYALAAGAFLIFVRGIALIFFMIFSPIMFLGWIFPQFKSFTSKYWSMFLSNAFMAPAFLFCIYLTFTIMSGFKYQVTTEGSGSLGNLFSQEDTANGIRALIVFTLTIGMMLASISIAKRMGAFGGGLVVSVGDNLRKRGLNLLGSGSGLIYRNTGGRLAKGAINYMDKNGVSNWVGGRALRGGLNSAYKYGAGGVGLAQTRSDIESHRAEVTKNRSRMTSANSVASANADIDQGLATAGRLAELRTKANTTTGLSAKEQKEKDELETIEAKMRTAATGLTKPQLEEMGSKRRDKIAHLLTTSQSKDFNKSDKVGAGEINSFNAARKNAVMAKITKTVGGVSTVDIGAISKLSKPQLATLGADWLMENAHLLSPTQFEEMRKTGDDSSVFSDEQAASFSEKRTTKFKDVVANITTTANQTFLTAYLEGIKTKHKEIASLPVEVLTNSITAGYLNSKVLKEIDNKSEIERGDKTVIATNVRRLARLGVGPAIDGEKYLNTAKVVTDGEWV